ncbi:OB-fold-containig protein [Spirulina subsalsa]|uniref:OB-fold-containig protein n=1 Tax=Spirulina subsalsa TaxID=54311 RepID=UPI0004745157|nr:OB-fold-containig protein [Spirulina subsalsa]
MLYSLSHLPYWIILGVGIALFLFVIASGGGDDELDLDGELEVGNGILEADADPDLESNGEFSAAQVLGWLGVGKAPLILLLATNLSLWGVTGWVVNTVVGSITGEIPVTFWGWGGVIFGTTLIFSFYLGSWIARPIGLLFAPFGEDASGDRLIGCIGTVTSKTIPPITEGKIGQVDVSDPNHNLVTVAATLPDWATFAPQRGQKVIVVDRRPHSYQVIAKDSSDEDRWLANHSEIQDS